MLVCEGAPPRQRKPRRVAIWRNCAKSRDHGDWTAVRPRKFHAERIASVAKREMSTYYGVVKHQVEGGALARLRNEDLKPAKLMGLIMSDDNVPAETGPSHTGKTDSWRRHLPYLLVLALALAGVAYANMSQKSPAGYWELLALISGIVCIFTEWEGRRQTGACQAGLDPGCTLDCCPR